MEATRVAPSGPATAVIAFSATRGSPLIASSGSAMK